MIEKIGLAGLLFLWLNAIAVAFVVPYVCGLALSQNRWIGLLAGAAISAPVTARAWYWIRKSHRQWQERHRRVAPDQTGDQNAHGR